MLVSSTGGNKKVHSKIITKKFMQSHFDIDRHGFLGANTDISAVHGPIADTDNWHVQNF